MMKFCAVAAIAFSASAALALPTDFTGEGSGFFNASTLTAAAFNTCVSSAGGGSNNVLAWGSPALTCPFAGGTFIAADSRLSVDTVAFSETVTTPGLSEVKVAQLSWFNSSTAFLTTPPIFSVSGEINVDIAAPGDFQLTQPLSFTVVNTVNPTGDLITAATFSNFDVSLPLSLGGDLHLLSFSAMLEGAGSLTNLGKGLFAWTNPEQNVSTLHIYANIQAVPLPATAWMLIASVAGLAALSRARRHAA